MKQFNCLVLDDSLSDQLSIEMILTQFPEIETIYISNSKEFLYEVAKRSYTLIIVDIQLQESMTGIDLLKYLKDASTWVIICSAYESKVYYNQYKSLHFTKFYVQKPVDEFIFKTHIESFLFSKKQSF
jgi:CheY-like chemotaxis protein